MEDRLQKVLSKAGFGSRRTCEAIIAENRVTVNGNTAKLGDKADPFKDKIMVDGKAIPAVAVQKIYIALNKPRGVLSDVDPKDDRKTIRDLIPVEGHLFAVGRLDLDSEGLILLTNDGELANRLTHPRYGHEKEYRVLVASRPDEEQLAAWRRGIVLEDGHKTLPAIVSIEETVGNRAWLRIVMKEGRKRQIREVGSRLGLPVNRLIRVRIGTLHLGRMKTKEWRYLKPEEVQRLKDHVSDKPGKSRRNWRRPPKK